MSEVSDAVVIVVSEETGKISVAINGTLTRSLDEETLKKAVTKALIPKEIKIKDKTKFWKGVFK